MEPRLPQEIIDYIIDCSAFPRNLKILKNLSLVSRTFLHRSQRHIFAIVSIPCAVHHGKIQTGGRRIDQLYYLFHHSPHIVGHVHEIRLVVVKHDDSWTAGNPKFEWIMKQLTRNTTFNRFHFHGHLPTDKLISPDHLQSFEQSFSQPYIVPFITSLKLYRIKNIPISLLLHSPNLKKLTLIRSTLESRILPPTMHDITFPKLQELYYHRSNDMVTALFVKPHNDSKPLLDLSHLHTLSVNQDSLDDIQCAIRLIEVTATSLKQLNFVHRNSNTYVPFTGLLNLSNIPNLRGLRLDTVCGDKGALTDLYNFLNTVQPSHKISKVRITVHMTDRTPSPKDDLTAWCTKLDAVITKLHQKKTISFHLQFFFFPQPPTIIPFNVSKRKRVLRQMGDMTTSQFSQSVLAKFPRVALHPGVTVAITRQMDDHQHLGVVKHFFHRIRDLVRRR